MSTWCSRAWTGLPNNLYVSINMDCLSDDWYWNSVAENFGILNTGGGRIYRYLYITIHSCQGMYCGTKMSCNMYTCIHMLYYIIYYTNMSTTNKIIPQNSRYYINGLVQERCNSSALAMELRLSCINPSICNMIYILSWPMCHDWYYIITEHIVPTLLSEYIIYIIICVRYCHTLQCVSNGVTSFLH